MHSSFGSDWPDEGQILKGCLITALLLVELGILLGKFVF